MELGLTVINELVPMYRAEPLESGATIICSRIVGLLSPNDIRSTVGNRIGRDILVLAQISKRV